MKKVIVLSLLAMVLTFGIQEIGIAEEVYVPKTIIQAKWGNGPGEFGIYTTAKPRDTSDRPLDSFRGPDALDIDRNGNIYIFDPVNWRVLIYNESGKYKSAVSLEKDPDTGDYDFKGGYVGGYWWEYDFIKVDSEGNIYLATTDDIIRTDYLRKFNKEGKLIKVYLSKNAEERLKKLWSPEEYQQRHGQYFDELKKTGKFEVIDSTIIDPLRAGRPNTNPEISHLFFKLFPSEYCPIDGQTEHSPSGLLSSDYKRNKKVVFYKILDMIDLLPLCTRSVYEEKRKELQELGYKKVFYTLVVDAEKNLEKIVAIPASEDSAFFHPWKEDVYGNLYLMTWVRDEKRSKERFTIYKQFINKFNFKGNLIATIETSTPLTRDKPFPFISWKGDIYRIIWDNNKLEEGLKIIRWRKK